jgi:hypothetical protein
MAELVPLEEADAVTEWIREVRETTVCLGADLPFEDGAGPRRARDGGFDVTDDEIQVAVTIRERNMDASGQPVFEWALTERFSEISRWFVPGPGVRAWLVIALAIVGSGAALASARRGRATPHEQALAWLSAAFLVLTLVSPLHIPGWQYLAPRFASLTMVLGLALLRPPEFASPRATRALLPLVTACCIGSQLVSARLHRQLATGCADALSGLDVPLHFEGPWLPIVLVRTCGTPRDPVQGPVPRASMATNTPLLYLVEHGGIGTMMFNGAASIHAVAFTGSKRPPPPDPRPLAIAESQWVETDPKLRGSVMTELAADGMPFEGIHMIGGRLSDVALFKDRGYVTEFQSGSLFIARFDGCPAELLLQPGALDGEALYYEYGLFSQASLTLEPRALATEIVKRDTPVIDGAIHVPLKSRPCGEVWIRVVWDADGSSTFTPGDRTCVNARWQGRLRANVSRDHTAMTCVSPP